MRRVLLTAIAAYCDFGVGAAGQGDVEGDVEGDAGQGDVDCGCCCGAMGGGAGGVEAAGCAFGFGFGAGGAVARRRRTGFFFLTGFTGVSLTATGLGRSFDVPSPIGSSLSSSVSGWKPVSVNVTEKALSAGIASAQGVRQLSPVDVLASAPGGSDSKRMVSFAGSILNGFLKVIESDEHAARTRLAPMMAMTRYIAAIRPALAAQAASLLTKNTGRARGLQRRGGR